MKGRVVSNLSRSVLMVCAAVAAHAWSQPVHAASLCLTPEAGAALQPIVSSGALGGALGSNLRLEGVSISGAQIALVVVDQQQRTHTITLAVPGEHREPPDSNGQQFGYHLTLSPRGHAPEVSRMLLAAAALVDRTVPPAAIITCGGGPSLDRAQGDEATPALRAHEVGLQRDWIDQPRKDRWWTSFLIIVGLLATMAVVWTPFRYGLFNCFVALGLLLAGAIAGISLLELGLRITGAERALISPALYLQTSDLPVHRVSSDPFLHYELAPGTEFSGTGHDRNYRVGIDPLGARRPEHPRKKSAGTFRILCFGGSTMYGASVDDDETIPARLEAHLNRQLSDVAGRTNFEVWNFGTSAYTLGQATHLAFSRLAALDPDLIIVQHHNVGRRPFLATADFRVDGDPPDLQRLDVDFYSEQFSVPERVPLHLHVELLKYSKLYRVLTAFKTLVAQRSHWLCSHCDEISASKARALSVAAEARGVPVLFVSIPSGGGMASPATIFPELAPERFIDLFTPDREPAYYEVHPPAKILDEYASSLAGTLNARGLLPSI